MYAADVKKKLEKITAKADMKNPFVNILGAAEKRTSTCMDKLMGNGHASSSDLAPKGTPEADGAFTMESVPLNKEARGQRDGPRKSLTQDLANLGDSPSTDKVAHVLQGFNAKLRGLDADTKTNKDRLAEVFRMTQELYFASFGKDR